MNCIVCGKPATKIMKIIVDNLGVDFTGQAAHCGLPECATNALRMLQADSTKSIEMALLARLKRCEIDRHVF